MPVIKPFKAVHYNPRKISDFRKVVAPPYDVISPEEQSFLHNLSPYNFTHIDLAKDKPSDDKNENKYTRAKTIFDEWLQKGVLIEDGHPSIYFYKQDYKIQGQKHTRLGFISLLTLKDDGDSKVYPHENTHANAVDDRFQLTRSLKSNLSCIFVCYSDQQKKVENIFFKQLSNTEPMIDVEDETAIRHRLWRLSDTQLIAEINGSLEGQNLFIADGHHRYKVAQEYRKACLEKRAGSNGQEPFNYVMTYFTNIDSRDLQIFPIHRVIRKFPQNIEFLEEFFRIDRIKSKEDLPILLGRAGKNEHTFGLYTRDDVKLLRLKNKSLIDEMIKEGSHDYKNLDASILKAFIFDRLGIKSDHNLVYTKDFNEVIAMVDNAQADAGFILNGVTIPQLKAIALNGEKMPPKTTYFYPKVLSGLTVYKME